MLQFLEHKTPFSLLTREDTVRLMETVGKRILPVLDFIRSTQLNVGIRWFSCPVCEHPCVSTRVWAPGVPKRIESWKSQHCKGWVGGGGVIFFCFLERHTHRNHIYKSKLVLANDSIPLPVPHMSPGYTAVLSVVRQIPSCRALPPPAFLPKAAGDFSFQINNRMLAIIVPSLLHLLSHCTGPPHYLARELRARACTPNLKQDATLNIAAELCVASGKWCNPFPHSRESVLCLQFCVLICPKCDPNSLLLFYTLYAIVLKYRKRLFH